VVADLHPDRDDGSELIWAPTICACGPDVTLSLG
jgi:hypothetical protein